MAQSHHQAPVVFAAAKQDLNNNNSNNAVPTNIIVTDQDNKEISADRESRSNVSSDRKAFSRSPSSSSLTILSSNENDHGSTVGKMLLAGRKLNGSSSKLETSFRASILSPKLSATSTASSQKSDSSQLSKLNFFRKDSHGKHKENNQSKNSDNSNNVNGEKLKSNSSSKLELRRFFKNFVNPPSKLLEAQGNINKSIKNNIKDIADHQHDHYLHRYNILHNHNKDKQAKTSNLHQQNAQQKEAQQHEAQHEAQAKVAQEHNKMFFGAETPQELISKYGVPGKILGEGAGGSVAIVESSSDGKIYAVKQFRPKSSKETDYDYTKKVQSEFCVGSTLHHENIIETYDMIKEGANVLIVMEYCPYDFFTLVMSGLLHKHEIACYIKQIINGVNYLHSVGLAHRDLKLDNCVVNPDGILKLIDFGSSVVFKYPYEDTIIYAKGVVGSDPYLAPEVFQSGHYDPRPADIWSIAIIFCCMTLRRFPWKVPKLSDGSFKAFSVLPDNLKLQSLKISEKAHNAPIDSQETLSSDDLLHNRSSPTPPLPDHKLTLEEQHQLQAKTNYISNSTTTAFAPRSKTRGPYRLLRLLPHASRPLIGAMLDLNPNKRITMEGILNDEWFSSIDVCHYDASNQLVKGKSHEHHLVTEAELAKIQEEKEKAKKIEEQIVG